MHRFLSSAGLWPTLVSVLAHFVQPLLFHLFFFHHLLFLSLDSCSIGRPLRRYIHSSPVLPIFLFLFLTSLFPLPVCVCRLSFTSSDHSATTLTPPFLASSQHLNMSVVFPGLWLHQKQRCFYFSTLNGAVMECQNYWSIMFVLLFTLRAANPCRMPFSVATVIHVTTVCWTLTLNSSFPIIGLRFLLML